MSLKTRNKVEASFSMSSMTDLVFLLLIFFMITSTLIAPNALDLILPKSSAQTDKKPSVSVSITEDLTFAVDRQVVDKAQIENILKQRLANVEEPTIALHAQKNVPIEQVVDIMDIARNNHFRVILATNPK